MKMTANHALKRTWRERRGCQSLRPVRRVAELSALADVHRLVSIVALCLCFGCTTSGPVVSTDVDRAVT